MDELALRFQRLIDCLIRRLRLGPPPQPSQRRFLIVQIDGLSRAVLERALAAGRMPVLRGLLRRHGFRLEPMSVGLPTSTPAFQLAAMYGVRPDTPGFHYYDRHRGAEVYFPRAGDAAYVEATQTRGRAGILAGGSAYGCVFTGGAPSSLFSFAAITRPTGAGLVRAVSAFVVLGWVVVKSLVVSAFELVRAGLRFIADPVGESQRGWRWLAFKLGISVWLRELFTLAASRDLYLGSPAIYVNYLDYDVFAHAYGPRHRRALIALRRIDRSLGQLWRVLRRVPEHRYDLYLLSDHGQIACVPYARLSGGASFEHRIQEEVLGPGAARAEVGAGRRKALGGVAALRRHGAPGLFQRFANYLERDFPRRLGQAPGPRAGEAVRVVVAGPNAFVYFLDSPDPLTIERLDRRAPGLVDELSRLRGVGFVLARSEAGPVCVWRGKRYALDRDEAGPFEGREDREAVLRGLRDLMAMPSAGDLVIYGHDSPDGHVSYLLEMGAHGGPAEEELETFIIAPPGARLPSPITHPVQLYPHFIAYQEGDLCA